jgi:hypothetical protein
MFTAHLHQATTLTPEQFVAGLTDFGPGREELFTNSTDRYLKVHERGATEAEVTEGSRGVWETLHYDWSNPTHVVLTTTDSNTWGGRSKFVYDLKPQVNGRTDVDVTVVREGKNLKGKAFAAMLNVVGKRVIERDLERTVRAIEARNAPRG